MPTPTSPLAPNLTEPPLSTGSRVRAPATERLWFLDFLRAVSAIAIAAYHLGYFFWVYNDQAPALWLAKPIPHLHIAGYLRHFKEFIERSHIDFGQACVAIFFLVSGFVIPLALQRTTRKHFAVSRLLRIYPTYWCALAFTLSCLAASAVLNGMPFAYSPGDILFNLSLCQDWAGKPLIDGVSWTLVIEIKFYVLCALMYLSRHHKQPLFLLSVAALLAATSFFAQLLMPYSAQGGSPWVPALGVVLTNANRLMFMFLGTAIYQLWQRQWSPGIFLCTVTTLSVLYTISAAVAQLRSPGECNTVSSYLLGAIFFSLIFLLRNKIPRNNALQFLADISYPLYLVHSLAGCAILSALYPYTRNMFLDLLLTVPAVGTVAVLIHRFVEKPSLDLSNRLKRKMVSSIEG